MAESPFAPSRRYLAGSGVPPPGDVQQVAWLQQFFRGKFLADLTREAIAGVGEVKRREASPSTANRYLAMIRAILRRAALLGELPDHLAELVRFSLAGAAPRQCQRLRVVAD